VARFLADRDVMRPSPDSATLKLAFTKADRRTQRRSDGTIVVEGSRFEIPNRYRHFTRIEIRYASWDLAHIYLVDEHTGAVLCRLFPQDKTRNASGLRRPLDQVAPQPVTAPPAGGIAPLLAKLIEQQADSGLPPSYLPKDEQGDDT
jgi:putative transposase